MMMGLPRGLQLPPDKATPYQQVPCWLLERWARREPSPGGARVQVDVTRNRSTRHPRAGLQFCRCGVGDLGVQAPADPEAREGEGSPAPHGSVRCPAPGPGSYGLVGLVCSLCKAVLTSGPLLWHSGADFFPPSPSSPQGCKGLGER